MMIDPRILTPKGERIPLFILITFISNGQRIASDNVDLNEDECKIWVRSEIGKPRHKGKAILVCRNGQWALRVSLLSLYKIRWFLWMKNLKIKSHK